MYHFQEKCVECPLNNKKREEVSKPFFEPKIQINRKEVVCDPKKSLHPKTKTAFNNVILSGGLHMICRNNQFRQMPYNK